MVTVGHRAEGSPGAVGTLAFVEVEIHSPRPELPPLTPVPVVVDADLLIRNVGYAVREGVERSLITHARPGYARAGGIPLFATTSVALEVERHLPEVAARCGRSITDVQATWNRVFRPRVVFVPVGGKEVDDARVAAVRQLHAKDTPTATLAVLLAECVLLTHNVKHFRPLGIAGQDVGKLSIEAHSLGAALKQADAATLVPRLLGYGAYEGVRRAAVAVGPDVLLAAALLGLGLIVRYWEAEQLRRTREGVGQVIREIGPPVAAFLERANAASATLWQFAVLPAEPRPALAHVCRELALAGLLSTQEIARSLSFHGYRFSTGDHRTRTRAWLTDEACFHEAMRGHWSLGYVIRPLDS